MKISNYYENLTIWLEILINIKPNQKYQNLKLLRKPQHLAGNPFKIKPNEKCENLNFCENLQIWLEILNKKYLKFWLQTTT